MLAIPQAQASHDTGLFVRNEWRNLSLTPAQKGLLFTLATYFGQNQSCWPSLTTLAQAHGCSRRYVYMLLGQLESLGVITRLRRNHGLRETTIYQLGKYSSLVAREIGCTELGKYSSQAREIGFPPTYTEENVHREHTQCSASLAQSATSLNGKNAKTSLDAPQQELAILIPVKHPNHPKRPKQKPKPRFEAPAKEEVFAAAEKRGIPRVETTIFWHTMQENDWHRGKHKVKSWERVLICWHLRGYLKARVEVKR